MKKLLAVAFLFVAFVSFSQVTFRPGIRAGVNFSHLTDNGNQYVYDYYDGSQIQPTEYKNKTDFYIGLYGALRLSKFYMLQPEINYSRQGSDVEFSTPAGRRETSLNLDYISVGIVNKFTFNRVFIELGPTIDIIVDKPKDYNQVYFAETGDVDTGYYYSNSYIQADSDIDLGFIGGLGVAITKNIAVEARIKKGVIPVIDLSDSNHTNVVYSLGAAYTFDLK